MLTMFIVLVIFFEAVLDHGSSASLSEGVKQGKEQVNITPTSVFSSLPLIIFSYMYQINIPSIYTEMENPTIPKMRTVLIVGTTLAAVAYVIAGFFGYVAFTGSSPEEQKVIFGDAILFAPYAMPDTGDLPVVLYISLFGMMVVVAFATPFCVLPTKDSIQDIRNKKFTPKENIVWTFVLMIIAFAFATPFTSITVPMTILGATTNSAIGFLLPICYYLRMERKTSKWTNMKVISYIIFIFICISSVIELTMLFLGDDDD